MSSKPLLVQFADQERRWLREIQEEEGLESEGSTVKWLVRGYKSKKIVRAVEMENLKLRQELASLVDQVEKIKRNLGGVIPDGAPLEPAEHQIDDLEAGNSISEKSRSRSRPAK